MPERDNGRLPLAEPLPPTNSAPPPPQVAFRFRGFSVGWPCAVGNEALWRRGRRERGRERVGWPGWSRRMQVLPPEDRASQLTGNCRSPWGLLQCAVAVVQRVKCFCLSGFLVGDVESPIRISGHPDCT